MMTDEKFLAHLTYWHKLEKSIPEDIYEYDADGKILGIVGETNYLSFCVDVLNLKNISIQESDKLASKLSEILECNGVTSIRSKHDDTLLYLIVDAGDLYVPTIAYDAENRNFVLTDEGSLREYVEDLKTDYYLVSGFMQ